MLKIKSLPNLISESKIVRTLVILNGFLLCNYPINIKQYLMLPIRTNMVNNNPLG